VWPVVMVALPCTGCWFASLHVRRVGVVGWAVKGQPVVSAVCHLSF